MCATSNFEHKFLFNFLVFFFFILLIPSPIRFSFHIPVHWVAFQFGRLMHFIFVIYIFFIARKPIRETCIATSMFLMAFAVAICDMDSSKRVCILYSPKTKRIRRCHNGKHFPLIFIHFHPHLWPTSRSVPCFSSQSSVCPLQNPFISEPLLPVWYV